jgi:cellulose biosynthesis protein BcsQ
MSDEKKHKPLTRALAQHVGSSPWSDRPRAAAEVMDSSPGRYQDILIDAGGRDSVELRAALVVAGHAFIPIQASQFDIWTLSRVNELVNTARGFNSVSEPSSS